MKQRVRVLVEHTDISGETQSEAGQNTFDPRSASRPRQGWAEQFQRMAQLGDDRLLDGEDISAWDKTEWEW